MKIDLPLPLVRCQMRQSTDQRATQSRSNIEKTHYCIIKYVFIVHRGVR